MNSDLYQRVLKVIIWSSDFDLKLKRKLVYAAGIQPKHRSKSTYEQQKKKDIKFKFWSGVKVLT